MVQLVAVEGDKWHRTFFFSCAVTVVSAPPHPPVTIIMVECIETHTLTYTLTHIPLNNLYIFFVPFFEFKKKKAMEELFEVCVHASAAPLLFTASRYVSWDEDAGLCMCVCVCYCIIYCTALFFSSFFRLDGMSAVASSRLHFPHSIFCSLSFTVFFFILLSSWTSSSRSSGTTSRLCV